MELPRCIPAACRGSQASLWSAASLATKAYCNSALLSVQAAQRSFSSPANGGAHERVTLCWVEATGTGAMGGSGILEVEPSSGCQEPYIRSR